MPISLPTPQSVIINQAKITRFEVNVEDNSVSIYYDRGYDNDGTWISVEQCSKSFKNVTFPDDIYTSVKSFLYAVLNPTL